MEYSFGRKSNQKQGIDKTLCHIWEYGGKLETLNNVLQATPICGKFFFCIMIDLSKIKNIWDTLETCTQVMNDVYSTTQNSPELIIICGKYDLFKNYGKQDSRFYVYKNIFYYLSVIFVITIFFQTVKLKSLSARLSEASHCLIMRT